MDLIIVSNAHDDTKRRLTQDAINSARNSDRQVKQIVIIEQQRYIKYISAITLNYRFEFNYNKCLNFGIEYLKNNSDDYYIALCNNDLIFHYKWVHEIIKSMKENNCGSASPYFKNLHSELYPEINKDEIGYDVRKFVLGWCIVLNRDTLSKIGKICEGVKFWYSDNLYSEQIKLKKIKHVLSFKSRVDHIESQTLFGNKKIKEYTGGQVYLYREAVRKLRKENTE